MPYVRRASIGYHNQSCDFHGTATGEEVPRLEIQSAGSRCTGPKRSMAQGTGYTSAHHTVFEGYLSHTSYPAHVSDSLRSPYDGLRYILFPEPCCVSVQCT